MWFQGVERHWVVGLLINFIGYCPVFIPGILILKYIKTTGYLDRGPKKCLTPLIRLCFYGSEETIDDSLSQDKPVGAKLGESAVKQSDWKAFWNLIICFGGLQVTFKYLVFRQKIA